MKSWTDAVALAVVGVTLLGISAFVIMLTIISATGGSC